MSKLENCPVCGSSHTSSYSIGATASINGKIDFNFIVCKDCGYALLSPGIPFMDEPLPNEELEAEWNRRAKLIGAKLHENSRGVRANVIYLVDGEDDGCR